MTVSAHMVCMCSVELSPIIICDFSTPVKLFPAWGTSYSSICKGGTVEVECLTTTPHGFLFWKINDDIKQEFQPLSNKSASPTQNIALALTNSTSVMGGVMYTSMATVRNVHKRTTILCSDGNMAKTFLYNLKSMLFTSYSYCNLLCTKMLLYTHAGSHSIDYVCKLSYNQVELSWKRAECCEQYFVNVSDGIKATGNTTQVKWNVSRNNQVMIVPVRMQCLDQTGERVPVSHTMLRITGKKNGGMH